MNLLDTNDEVIAIMDNNTYNLRNTQTADIDYTIYMFIFNKLTKEASEYIINKDVNSRVLEVGSKINLVIDKPLSRGTNNEDLIGKEKDIIPNKIIYVSNSFSIDRSKLDQQIVDFINSFISEYNS